MSHKPEHAMWAPSLRCIDPDCKDEFGHRVTVSSNYIPVATRRLSIWYKIAEYPMRWLAKSIAKNPSWQNTTATEMAPATEATEPTEPSWPKSAPDWPPDEPAPWGTRDEEV